MTGLDIVREQIRIAAGEPLSMTQKDVTFRGTAIELRINAEDPKNNFMASPGVVQIYQSPGGHGTAPRRRRLPGLRNSALLRFHAGETHRLRFYWREAVDRLNRTLSSFVIAGVKTTIPYYKQIVNDRDFIEQRFDTSYIETHPHLLDYQDDVPAMEKLADLIAEINAHGYNPYTETR